jgi:hypothetical protein
MPVSSIVSPATKPLIVPASPPVSPAINECAPVSKTIEPKLTNFVDRSRR